MSPRSAWFSGVFPLPQASTIFLSLFLLFTLVNSPRQIALLSGSREYRLQAYKMASQIARMAKRIEAAKHS